jgi:hypothetical protein
MTPDYSHWRKHGIVGPIVHMRIADMQNDVELTRRILIAIQERDTLRPAPVQVHDYEPVLTMRHVKRLLDDGMIEGRVSETMGSEAPLVFVTDMTTAGHNLLAVLEDKQIWERLKTALSPEELAQMPLKALAKIAWELAEKKIRNKIGL